MVLVSETNDVIICDRSVTNNTLLATITTVYVATVKNLSSETVDKSQRTRLQRRCATQRGASVQLRP